MPDDDDTSNDVNGAGGPVTFGTSGDDNLSGTSAGDSILGQAGDDTIRGGEGKDLLLGGEGNDRLYGGEGHDVLEGQPGDDHLYGGEGNDWLLGGTGDDVLYGGAGDDTLYGEAGDDTFVYEPGGGNDTIKDFTDGEDVIDLSGFSDIRGFVDLTLTDGDDGVTIDLTGHDGGGTILLEGFSRDDLDETDFVFGTVDLGDITDISDAGSRDDTVDGDADDTDYFRFTLTEAKEVELTLSSLDFDADLVIESEDGTVLYSSREDGTADEEITETLEAGTYYVRVESQEEGTNDYTLSYDVDEADLTVSNVETEVDAM